MFMSTRRNFLKTTATVSLATVAGSSAIKTSAFTNNFEQVQQELPVVVSTWEHGVEANKVAWEILNKGGTALDAVEAGVKVSEADPNVTSVGYGGLPDRDGIVTLDASIMDDKGNCGAVAFLQNIMHPISVAKLVMEKTPHVLLVGEGAYKFALENGFKKTKLLTPESKEKYENWLKDQQYKQKKWNEWHDTIGMLAIDHNGNLSGACTTSGLPYKYHGRVGDSPIIGAGLYVDNEIGAAAATGKGEAVIKIAGSFLVVEYMRQGKAPNEACRLAIERIAKKQPDYKAFQVGFIALDKKGRVGTYSIQRGFQAASYCKQNPGDAEAKNILFDSAFYVM